MINYIIYMKDYIDDNSALSQETKLTREMVTNYLNCKKIILDFKDCKDLSTLFIKNSIIKAMKIMNDPKVIVKNISSNNLLALKYLVREEFKTEEDNDD